MSDLSDLQQFYELICGLAKRTGGPFLLRDLDLKQLPERGVYFFFDPEEHRTISGSGLRIVRVGTHGLKRGSKSTLGQRLRQHRGTGSGGGNHRGSVFRLLVGQALIASAKAGVCKSWGHKDSAGRAAEHFGITREELKFSEGPVEQLVSQYIGRLQVAWLEIPDEPGPDSKRGVVERTSIALLSCGNDTPADAPTDLWLGRQSTRDRVQQSGLWNQRHVNEQVDPGMKAELFNQLKQSHR